MSTNKPVKTNKTIVNKGKTSVTQMNLSALTLATSGLSIPRLFYQLVIFVIDGSRSMDSKTINKTTKAEDINITIHKVLNRLKSSKNVSSFDICFYVFSDIHKDVFGVKQVSDIANDQNFNPIRLIESSAGTKLSSCLEDVNKTTVSYLEKNFEKSSQVLILLLSDGEIDDYASALIQAKKTMELPKVTFSSMYLQSMIDESSQYYSWDEDSDEMDYSEEWSIDEVKSSAQRVAMRFEEFASSKDLFTTSLDPEEIRRHMIKSISKVSKVD